MKVFILIKDFNLKLRNSLIVKYLLRLRKRFRRYFDFKLRKLLIKIVNIWN